MKARFKDMTFTANGRQIISLVIEGDYREQYDKLKDVDLDIEIKRHREKRSKNANDYLWCLCTKIAEEMGISSVDVYRRQIEAAGVFEDMAVKEGSLDRWFAAWGSRGIGWFCKIVDNSFPGYKRVRCYYGSSTYNTHEMSRVINNTIEDAKALGIETATPAELALLMDDWRKRA